MFPDNICQNIDILVVINVQKNNFGFHSNQKTQGQKHRVNNLNFKYQVCQIKLRHLNTFLQFRLLFHEPHCISTEASHFCVLREFCSNLWAFSPTLLLLPTRNTDPAHPSTTNLLCFLKWRQKTISFQC